MPARRKARRRALEVLFEAEQRSVDPLVLLDERSNDPERPVSAYSVEVVRGVVRDGDRIDEILATYSQGWALDRMPAVDRSALRIGVWELLRNPDVPPEVAISEAVVIVEDLSTAESPRFVNGLLARIAALRHTLTG